METARTQRTAVHDSTLADQGAPDSHSKNRSFVPGGRSNLKLLSFVSSMDTQKHEGFKCRFFLTRCCLAPHRRM